MGIEGFSRYNKGEKIIVVGIFSINMAEKDGEIGSSKSEAGDGKPLETCDVDFGPH